MKCLASLLLLLGLSCTTLANTFKLECLDAYGAKTRLALVEVNTDAATVKIYSEATHAWKSAVNVSITDATISYVEHEFNDPTSPAKSATINRVTGKYFANLANTPRKDGQCRKVSSDVR
jgi:hypothetical protein